MGLFPFFFGALPPKTRFRKVDVTAVVECLRTLTTTTEKLGELPYSDPCWVWTEGSASRLDLAVVDAHICSLFDTGKPPSSTSGLTSSWTGTTAATGLYLHSVLGLWNAGEPMERRLFRRVVAMLLRDLQNCPDQERTGDFWFWKVFAGACSLARHEVHAGDAVVGDLRRGFDGFVRSWSVAAGCVDWEAVRGRLARVCWPGGEVSEAKCVWERAMRDGPVEV